MNFENELKQLGILYDGQASITALVNGHVNIPEVPGVYFVGRTDTSIPKFIQWNYGTLYSKKNKAGKKVDHQLMYSNTDLSNNWIDNSYILYIGQSNDLRKRIRTYVNYYKRLIECQSIKDNYNNIAHRGGRSIWQIADAEKFIIVWAKTNPGEEKIIEGHLISSYKELYGKRPFANLKDGDNV